MTKQKIGIIYGGKSAEHSISLLTAKSIINAIDKEKYNVFPIFISLEGNWARGEQITSEIANQHDLIFSNFDNDISGLLFEDGRKFDIVFPVLHGPNGEDGTIQGLLEIMDIAYVGNNVLSSAAGMDKVVMKQLFAAYDLPQLPYVHFIEYTWKNKKEALIAEINENLSDSLNLIQQRQEILYDNPDHHFDHLTIVIDEVLALSEGVNKTIKDSFFSLMSQIALLGRATKVHLLLVSQRFDHNTIPVSVREQLNVLIQIGNINKKQKP